LLIFDGDKQTHWATSLFDLDFHWDFRWV